MEIQFKKVYRFNLDESQPEEILLDDRVSDFNGYIEDLILDVLGDPRRKRYLFPKDETSTKNALTEIFTKKKDNIALSFAQRLLRIENDVQNRIEHLDVEVQRGVLIQALVNHNDKMHYLIIKAEHFDYINEKDRKRTTGLPIKKKVFKAFSAPVDESGKKKYAYVSDYRPTISTYWWSTFLELEEEYTDDYNTETAFKAIEQKVLNKLKEEYPSDYLYLRNATVKYFRTNKEFVTSDFVEDFIKPYEPEDDRLNVEDLSAKIEALPEKVGFDSRFNIKKDKIKKRIIKKLPLTAQLELVIKEDIKWGEMVKAVKVDGAKYIRIRTDKGYDYFDKK